MLRLLDGLSECVTKGNAMFYRMFVFATLAVAMFAAAPALSAPTADDTKEATHDGKVVSISNDNLVMASKDGQQHSHTFAPNTKGDLRRQHVQGE